MGVTNEFRNAIDSVKEEYNYLKGLDMDKEEILDKMLDDVEMGTSLFVLEEGKLLTITQYIRTNRDLPPTVMGIDELVSKLEKLTYVPKFLGGATIRYINDDEAESEVIYYLVGDVIFEYCLNNTIGYEFNKTHINMI